MSIRTSPVRVLFVGGNRKNPRANLALFDKPDFVPAGEDCTYQNILEVVHRDSPNLIVIESLQGEEPFVAIESVMAERPTPIIVLHSNNEGKTEPFRALALGALDVIARPENPSPQFWTDLAHRIRILAQVRVVQHVRGKKRRRGEGPAAGEFPYPVVAIASSLGGPKALCTLLRMLPVDFGAPITICQHISQGFTGGFTQWLQNETRLHVVEASDGEILQPGSVFVAPSGYHLTLRADGRCRLDDSPAIMGFKPSCDMLLSSAARAFGKRAIGVVLTGMGRDGAAGLKEIRGRGGQTIAQDESTSVVYGMPREAVENGAAQTVLPIDQIAHALLKMVQQC
jgi:two-component system, chemotaxis family, protein-glutamate methylesterase/glutaminase